MWEKKTYSDLAKEYKISIKTIQSWIDQVKHPLTFPYEELRPEPIYLVIDAFYWEKGDGILIFKADNLGQNLLWINIKSETADKYIIGLNMILSQGWEVLGITVDGRKGIIPALKEYAPVQFCQFHQTAIVTRYLGKYPRLEANWELKRISLLLRDISKEKLKDLLVDWYLKYEQFLKEKTYYESGRWSYTHRRTRSCFRSFICNLDDLFTYRQYPCMPNTTNCIDGYISHLRTLHRSHNGTKLHRRRKITEEVLRGKSAKNYN